MTLPKKGLISTILSVVGIIIVILSYTVSETPTTAEKIIITVIFFTGIASMIASIVFGILGIHSKEKGFPKYAGMVIILLFIIGIALIPVAMAIFGFKEP